MPSIQAQRRTARVFRPRQPVPHPWNIIKQGSSFRKRSTKRKPPTERARKQTTNALQTRAAKDREIFSEIINHKETSAEDKLLFGVFDDMLQEAMYPAPAFLRNGAPCEMADCWVCEQFSARSEIAQWQSIQFLPKLPGIGNGDYQMIRALELDSLNSPVKQLRLSRVDKMLRYLLGLDVPPGTFRNIVNPSYSPEDSYGELQEYYQDLQHGSTTTQSDVVSTSLLKQRLFHRRSRTKRFQHLAEVSPVQSQPDGHGGTGEALPRREYRLDGRCEAVGWKSALHRWKRSAGRPREWRVSPYVCTGSGHRLPLTYMARGQLDWLPSHRSMPAKSTGVPKTARRTRQEATTLHELDMRDIDLDPTYGGDEVDEEAELQAIQAQSRDGIPLTIQQVSSEEITPGSIVPLPYLSYSGVIIGGEISLDRQIRQENHCTVYAATSLLYPDRNLEAKAFELQSITKSLRRYRKRNMEKVTNVVQQIRQGGYTFLIYEPDEQHPSEVDTHDSAHSGNRPLDIDEFPRLVRPAATRAEAARLRQKRRRQKRREPPSSGIPRAWVKGDLGLGVAGVCSTPLVSKDWPGDIDFYNSMTKGFIPKHPDLFLASPATNDLLKHPTPSKLASKSSLLDPEATTGTSLASMGALQNEISPKEQGCELLERQWDIFCSEHCRSESRVGSGDNSLSRLKLFGWRDILRGLSKTEELLRRSQDELAALRGGWNDWEAGHRAGKEEAFLDVQTLAELRSLRDRIVQLAEP